MDIIRFKVNINLPSAQHSNGFQSIHGIPCKPMGGFDQNHIYLAAPAGR